MNSYQNLDPSQVQGSGGYATVQGFDCISTSGATWQQTGHVSDCTSKRGAISLDGPYQERTESGTPGAGGPVSESQLLANPLTTDGLGPLQVGMTPADVSRVLGKTVTPQYLGEGTECGTVSPYGGAHPPVDLMFSNDRLVVVSAFSGPLRTPSGFGIGTPESAIRSKFGNALEVTQHEYVPQGHYLSFTATSDPSHRLVFETDGSAVTAMHGGKSPYVNYVEGCA